jgi:hypothetical protein
MYSILPTGATVVEDTKEDNKKDHIDDDCGVPIKTRDYHSSDIRFSTSSETRLVLVRLGLVLVRLGLVLVRLASVLVRLEMVLGQLPEHRLLGRTWPYIARPYFQKSSDN